MSENRRIELFKNGLLVVLFLSTILLLYLLWNSGAGIDIRVGDIIPIARNEAPVPETESVIRPEYIAFGYSDYSYKLAEGDLTGLQSEAFALIRDALSEGAASITEISEAQYTGITGRYSSVKIGLCVDFPGRAFAREMGFPQSDLFASVPHVSEIAFSELSKESIFLHDDRADKYYRIVLADGTSFVEILRSKAETGADIYYAAGTILGGGSKALMPITSESNLVEITYENEYEEGGREQRVNMAEAVFGENFDFVRRMTDSFGNITYMYGYGQKVLTANIDGSFSYSSEDEGAESSDYFDDLKTAMSFAADCGGWIYSGSGSGLMLSSVKESNTGRRSVRTFDFVQYSGGNEICLEAGPALSVTVVNGVVTNLSRNVAILSPASTASSKSPVSDAANVIAENCNHIYNVINGNVLAAATDEAFEFAADAVEEIGIAYFRSSKDNVMKPCWKIKAAGTTFCFDLFTALPLGFTE